MVKNILGDSQGVLISDCLSIYDEVNPLQQKCYTKRKMVGEKIAEARTK
jgi:hypothetical protein